MSHEHAHENGVTKNYTGTALLAFVLVGTLLLLMSTCHGPFHPGGGEAHATTEQHETGGAHDAKH